MMLSRTTPKRSTKPALSPEQHCPELCLPFVKLVDPSLQSSRPCDCWAPPRSSNRYTNSFEGTNYALTAVRLMRKGRDTNPYLSTHHLLLNIIDSMICKGRFWGSPEEGADSVAVAFVAALEDILVQADRMGLLDAHALAEADHLSTWLAKAKRVPKLQRQALEEAIAQRRRFALGERIGGALTNARDER